MPETLEKLRPDRDLQCYYLDPSAIAAFSETSSTGFTVSGTWRQQFDWAVVEWNRDNVFEHPAFRTLPDGDLSGLTLTYDEERENCILIDSDLAETVAWPHLRIWARKDDGSEEVYFVPLKNYAEPIEGDYESAYAEFTLSGLAVAGDHIGLAYSGQEFPTGLLLGQNFTHTIGTTDLAWEAQQIVDGINGAEFSVMKAQRSGTTIEVYYTAGDEIEDAETGANGNRWGLIAYSDGAAMWDSPGKIFENGASPNKWRITLDFSNLEGFTRDEFGVASATELIPVEKIQKIRKIRWTYSADQQMEEFERTEFKVTVSNWTVTGTGRGYSVAGRGSRRTEDEDPLMQYSGDWWVERGNYSGGMIHRTSTAGDSVTLTYFAPGAHALHVGTRYTANATDVEFEVDSEAAGATTLRIPEEDVLIRWKVGEYAGGTHTVTVTHAGTTGEDLWIDFIEVVVLATELPTFPSMPTITVATDWDTLHSVAIAPERTAWMIDSMGFHGRQNHYVGALLFYELYNQGNIFASKTITFSGTPEPGKKVRIEIGPSGGEVIVERTVQPGETLETIALSFAHNFNRGFTLFRAEASGGSVTVYARPLGEAGEVVEFIAYSESTTLTVSPTSGGLEDGEDGVWRTDLEASPRLNRAMRDWTRSFLAALDGYGIDAACAFSTEIKHGDPTPEAGIAQRDCAGIPFILPTPALQTNFSPTSLAFWKQVHADCAQVMDEAGLVPYLQFGEEQWWYFPHNGFPVEHPQRVDFASMPFYDAWTMSEFEARYSHVLAEITSNDVDPGAYPDEVEFLADILGEFTDAIIDYVRMSFPSARFEVLYPYDVNGTAFNRAVNFPDAAWTPARLDCLKTEGLSLTFTRNLKESEEGMGMGGPLGFAPTQRAHLVGLGDSTAPWLKETRIAEGRKFESVALFALDQFCLIGYELPFPVSGRRSFRVR